MAEVTWFKVLTDIFSDDKIKIIQSMPEGDSILVMWFKVLSQAGKTNDGGYIYLKKGMPYTAGMLATLFNKPQQIVEVALRTFTQFEMIDIDEHGYIFVTNWEKHQSIDKLNKIKEQTRQRVANHRAKKQLELMEGNASVTLPKQPDNATEVEVDLDIEKYTTTAPDGFEIVRIAYRKLHGVVDLPPQDSPALSTLLEEGITPELMITVMKDKYKPTVSTFRYYLNAIRERHAGMGKQAIPRRRVDPELEARKREIALNQWLERGGKADEFEYRPASNN